MLAVKDTLNTVDKTMVDEEDDIKSVGYDNPYDMDNHLKSTVNTAVARFGEIRTGLLAEARYKALAIRYQPPLHTSKLYTQ